MPSDNQEPEGFLPKTGNYQDLLSYRRAEIIYDLTFRFCEKHLKRGDRTIDQMVQSARSGKQNIAEGCKASITSTEMELKLVNVARASLEELLLDYQDYLRVRDHPLWDKNSKEALYARQLGRDPNESYETYRPFMDTRPPVVIANIAICLIHQANYLLDQQRRTLEKDFLKKGGLREQMTKARLDYRKKQQSQPPKPQRPPRPPQPPPAQ
jgi:four helix bundle suffix protein